MADNIHPLTEEHLASINQALEAADRANAQIKLAKMAGIDVSAQESQLKTSVDSLTRIKQVYFPGR
jgi:hypothetical protein